MSFQSKTILFGEDRTLPERSSDLLTPIVCGALLGVGSAALLWVTIVIHFGLANCFWW